MKVCAATLAMDFDAETGEKSSGDPEAQVSPVKPKADRKLQPSYAKQYTHNRTQHCLGQCLHCKQDIMGRKRNRTITFCSTECRIAHKTIQGRIKTCVHCQNSFTVTDKRTYQRKTCSDECFLAYASAIKAGKKLARLIPKSWVKFYRCIVCEKLYTVGTFSVWKGKNCCGPKCVSINISRANSLPPEKKVLVICHWCQKETLMRPCTVNQRRSTRMFCDRTCSGAWFSEQSKGDNWFKHRLGQKPLWNYGWSWKSSQGAALRRDKNTCRICKKTEEEIGQKPDVHHVIPFASFGKARHLEANALSNLLCLCRSCHMSIEPKNYVKWRRAQALGNQGQMSKELAHAISQIKVLRARV